MRFGRLALTAGGRQRPVEPADNSLDPIAGAGVQRFRVHAGLGPGVADDGQALLHRIVDEHEAGHHEGAVGQVEGRMAVRQPFHEADHVVAEKADRATIKARQAGCGAHRERGEQGAQFGQRVDPVQLDHPTRTAGVVHAHLVAHAREGDQRVQADEGIAAPLLAALHGLEQEGVSRIAGDLGKDGERRVEIGDDGAGHRDQVGLADHFGEQVRCGGIHGCFTWNATETRGGAAADRPGAVPRRGRWRGPGGGVPGWRGKRKKPRKQSASVAFLKTHRTGKSDQRPQARGCIVLTRLVNRDTLRLAFFLWIEPLEAVL